MCREAAGHLRQLLREDDTTKHIPVFTRTATSNALIGLLPKETYYFCQKRHRMVVAGIAAPSPPLRYHPRRQLIAGGAVCARASEARRITNLNHELTTPGKAVTRKQILAKLQSEEQKARRSKGDVHASARHWIANCAREHARQRHQNRSLLEKMTCTVTGQGALEDRSQCGVAPAAEVAVGNAVGIRRTGKSTEAPA